MACRNFRIASSKTAENTRGRALRLGKCVAQTEVCNVFTELSIIFPLKNGVVLPAANVVWAFVLQENCWTKSMVFCFSFTRIKCARFISHWVQFDSKLFHVTCRPQGNPTLKLNSSLNFWVCWKGMMLNDVEFLGTCGLGDRNDRGKMFARWILQNSLLGQSRMRGMDHPRDSWTCRCSMDGALVQFDFILSSPLAQTILAQELTRSSVSASFCVRVSCVGRASCRCRRSRWICWRTEVHQSNSPRTIPKKSVPKHGIGMNNTKMQIRLKQYKYGSLYSWVSECVWNLQTSGALALVAHLRHRHLCSRNLA